MKIYNITTLILYKCFLKHIKNNKNTTTRKKTNWLQNIKPKKLTQQRLFLQNKLTKKQNHKKENKTYISVTTSNMFLLNVEIANLSFLIFGLFPKMLNFKKKRIKCCVLLLRATIYLESVWGWYYNKNVYVWEGTSDGACRKDQAVKHDVEHHGKRDMMQFYWLLLVNNRIIKEK